MSKIKLILLIGFILRIILVIWSFSFPQNPDLLRHRDWGRIAHLYGVKDTYKTDHLEYGDIPNNLPPGSIYVISGMYNLQIQTSKLILKLLHAKEGSIYFLNVPLLDSFLKLPFIIADLILSFLIYKTVKSKKPEKEAILASSLFLFNPISWYNSAIWGQMDALTNLFFFLTLYLLMAGKCIPSIFFSIFSLFFKLTLLPMVAIFSLTLFVLKKIDFRKIFIATFLSLLIVFISSLPVSTNPQEWLKLFIANNISQEPQNITVNAFNFWFMLIKPFFGNKEFPPSQSIYFGLPLGVWATIVFMVTVAPLIKRIITLNGKILKHGNMFLILTTTSLLAFLFLPRMHERYLYPVFPLLATYLGLTGKFLKLFLLLSFFHMINLLVVWHPMLNILVIVFSDNFFQWGTSVALVISGMYLYIKTLKTAED